MIAAMPLADVMRTQRLLLRPPELGDAAEVHRAWAGRAETCRWLAWAPHRDEGETREELQALIEERASGASQSWLAETEGRLVGSARLAWISSIERELGFVVAPDDQRRGFGSEMVRALTEAALAEPDVQRVTASCHPDNTASVQLLAACAFEQEGRLRRCRRLPAFGDEPQDLLVFARLA